MSAKSNSRTCTPTAGCPDDSRTRPSSSGSAPTLPLDTSAMKPPISNFIRSIPLQILNDIGRRDALRNERHLRGNSYPIYRPST